MDHDGDERLGEAWHAHRAHLINVAFRILGDIGAAEDAVQEAYTRLLRTAPGEIDDERGWLIVVTSRICLDQIRSARARLVSPEPAGRFDTTSTRDADPADRVTLDDEVRLALEVVLQQLSPAERVAFVLHDVFQIPFDVIGDTIGRPASSCRQLATRARQRIAAAPDVARFGAAPPEQRLVTDRFIDACATGDLADLVAILAPDVAGDGDFGPGVEVAIVVGAAAVAQRTLAFLGHGATVVSHPLARTGTPALLVFTDRRLLAIIELTIVDGSIAHLHAAGDPATLTATTAALAAQAAVSP